MVAEGIFETLVVVSMHVLEWKLERLAAVHAVAFKIHLLLGEH
jgi:hypothetical protein